MPWGKEDFFGGIKNKVCHSVEKLSDIILSMWKFKTQSKNFATFKVQNFREIK